MKIGINHWTFPKDLSLAECFALAKRAGCDHIEVNLAEEGELSLATGEAEARALAQAARDAGIEISSLSTGLYWKYPATSNDAGQRAQSLEIARQQLRVAHWLGVDTALVVPGAVTPEVSYDVAYERAAQFVGDALPAAREAGVAIGIENVWNKFLLSPLEMRDFVDRFGDPHVGVYFDAGNILAYGFPQHWIRILAGRRLLRLPQPAAGGCALGRGAAGAGRGGLRGPRDGRGVRLQRARRVGAAPHRRLPAGRVRLRSR